MVELRTNSQLQLQQMMPSRGSMSSVDYILNFGLGQEIEIDSLIVTWPGGAKELVRNIVPNQLFEFDIKNASIPLTSEDELFIPVFTDVTNSLSSKFIHKERGFSDFDHQPLLPHRLSTQGPKMAAGDVNGDGLEDVYICGGAGQSGKLMLQTEGGDFINSIQHEISSQNLGEEIDAILFDADGDKDLDLFVARGSTEHSNEPVLMKDLFYTPFEVTYIHPDEFFEGILEAFFEEIEGFHGEKSPQLSLSLYIA